MRMMSAKNESARPAGSTPAREAAVLIARALQEAPFETDQGGDLYLRMTAERAIKGAAGGVRVALAGRDGSQVGRVSFLGARFTPDLVVETPGGASVAVTVTLLRGDAAPVGGALATALALAAAPRYGAVVALLLDRRLARRDPFADPLEAAPEAAGGDQEGKGGGGALSEAEGAFAARLWEHHGVRLVVRRQDPFGWG
jgi:hypothetical protein